jgi:glycosyltransferase involved in cell wall biosynthesis
VHFSVVVPAHNEELLLPRCIAAITRAATGVEGDVELVVSANRCSDSTTVVARRARALVVETDDRNIAAVRNAGAAAATGDVTVTIDADCVMSPIGLREIDRLLATGRYVGGGTKVVPERRSPGIAATYLFVTALTRSTGLSGGMFWCGRRDFEAIRGFDERLLLGEDLDFARRLRAHGRRTGRRFTTVRRAPIVASTRKFDRFGDWHMFAMGRQLREIRAAFRGTDPSWADRYFFEFNDTR